MRISVNIDAGEFVEQFVCDNGPTEVADIINIFLEEGADKFGDDILFAITKIEEKIASLKKEFEDE